MIYTRRFFDFDFFFLIIQNNIKLNRMLHAWTEACHQILVAEKSKSYEIYWRNA